VMQEYDRARCVPTRALQERTRQALEQFLTYLASQDVSGMKRLLAAEVRTLSDGGGEFLAALKPVIGRDKVIRFYMKTAAQRGAPPHITIRMLNGLPALLIERPQARMREAVRFVLRCDLDAEGRIKVWHAILASCKLTAVRFTPYIK
jgi:hypothetical protein